MSMKCWLGKDSTKAPQQTASLRHATQHVKSKQVKRARNTSKMLTISDNPKNEVNRFREVTAIFRSFTINDSRIM